MGQRRVSLRGETCIGVASVLSFVSLILLIFVHIGQVNTSKVPRGIYMVEVNMSGYNDALEAATRQTFTIYTENSTLPLGQNEGLRRNYYYGLYSYCGFVNSSAGGICSDKHLGQRFDPINTILTDLPDNITISVTKSFIPSFTDFTNSKYLGQSSKAAYWMILLGTICAVLAFGTGIFKHNYTFCVSTLFAIAGSLLLLIGASIWTVLVNRAKGVNSLIANTDVAVIPLGISVSLGPGASILWAAFATLFASVLPYMLSCCTWRG